MNITHLKYVLEIEKARSITAAAQNLFLSQPNLSRALREIEEEIGISLFERSAKGVIPTRSGSEFLAYAKTIVSQMNNLEAMYTTDKDESVSLTLCIPRATYLSLAYTDFLNKVKDKSRISLNIKERDFRSTINYVASGEAQLGVIRYRDLHESYFMALCEEKNLRYRHLLSYEPRIRVSKASPLAKCDKVSEEELSEYIELVYGDIQRDANLVYNTESGEEGSVSQKKIYLYERGSQLDILTNVDNTYTWASPSPREFLERFGLCEKKISKGGVTKKDLLIYRKGHIFSRAEKLLVECIEERAKELS